jgi:hypothetical protein
MERRCPATKRNGDRCSGKVPLGAYHCWFHDPKNADKRRRGAARGGRGNRARTKLTRDMHAYLEQLAEDVRSGTLEPYPASVMNAIAKTRLAILEYERRARETDELAAKLEAIEQALEGHGGGHYGFGS